MSDKIGGFIEVRKYENPEALWIKQVDAAKYKVALQRTDRLE